MASTSTNRCQVGRRVIHITRRTMMIAILLMIPRCGVGTRHWPRAILTAKLTATGVATGGRYTLRRKREALQSHGLLLSGRLRIEASTIRNQQVVGSNPTGGSKNMV